MTNKQKQKPSSPRKRGSSDFVPAEPKALDSRLRGNGGKFPVQTLHGHIHVKHGYPFKSEYFLDSGDHIVLTPGNFWESGGFKQQIGKEKFYTTTFPDEYLHKRGDLIVAMTEQTEGLLGSMAFVPEDGRYLHNQRIGKVTEVSGDICLGFLYYAFRTQSIRDQLSNTASGSKVRHTSPDRIYDVLLSLPLVKDQEGIAAVLSALDARIDLNNRINAELEALAKTIYDYWFVQFDFPDASGRPYKSSGGKMVWSESLKREIPSGWGAGVLSDIANITMGQSPAGESYNVQGKGTVFFQGSTDFGSRSPEVRMFTTSPSRMARDGDILVSVRAPVGTLNIADRDCCIGRGLAAMHSRNGSDGYLYRVMSDFKQIFDRRSSEGTTFGSITKDDLFGLRVLIPDAQVLKSYTRMANDWTHLAAVRDKESRELTQLRDWLLPLLMNGQVRVA
jgi:type I restriction enzyme S subunit